MWIDNGLIMSVTSPRSSPYPLLCWNSYPAFDYLCHRSLSDDYVALVLPQLDYCSKVVAGLPANQLSRLQFVLHATARLISSTCWCDHVTPLLQQLHWLSVPRHVEFKLCVLVYMCLRGLGPQYLSSDCTLVADILSHQWLRSANRQAPATWRQTLSDLLHHWCMTNTQWPGLLHDWWMTNTRWPGLLHHWWMGMECTAAKHHICTISFLLPAATEDVSFTLATLSLKCRFYSMF